MRAPSGTRRCSTWCTAARPPSRTRSGRPTTPCWTCGCSPRPACWALPWLTLIEDDHSRAVAGYAVNLEAPSALTTALAFRQAIWRKSWPGWHVCGIPDAFHVDHGSDFTSAHLEQAMADLRTRAYFSLPGQPRGRGEGGEDILHRCNDVPARAARVRAARHPGPGLGRPGSPWPGWTRRSGPSSGRSTTSPRTARPGWRRSSAGRPGRSSRACPTRSKQLDLLLLTVAKPRKIHPDGIHFQGLRYLDPVLAAYVGDSVIIRYDPRDMAEIRVFTGAGFLCRAICPELAGTTIGLKDITAARNARRRGPGSGTARAGQRRRPAAGRPPGTTAGPDGTARRKYACPHGPAAQALPNGVAGRP